MTTLYRLYDEADVLLYVGVTDNLHSRMQMHGSSSPWFGDVARTETDEHASRAGALAAEAQAIANDRPLHNRRGTGSKGGSVGVDLAAVVLAEIRAECARQNIKRGELARRTGITGVSISRKLNGSNPLMLGEALVLANALDISLDSLIRRAQERAA